LIGFPIQETNINPMKDYKLLVRFNKVSWQSQPQGTGDITAVGIGNNKILNSNNVNMDVQMAKKASNTSSKSKDEIW
jgi:hypothetical protein